MSAMEARIEAELAGLEALSSRQLRERWSAMALGPSPRISPAMLRLALAWEIQARTLGGHDRAAARMLAQLMAARTSSAAVTPGMRLVRAWNGVAHVVAIGEDGVIEWNGKAWNSLSEVARHHRHALVGARLLRPQEKDGGRMKTVRCAIYTRKSSEEGLAQDFYSLDAQREACSAYILSQAS